MFVICVGYPRVMVVRVSFRLSAPLKNSRRKYSLSNVVSCDFQLRVFALLVLLFAPCALMLREELRGWVPRKLA